MKRDWMAEIPGTVRRQIEDRGPDGPECIIADPRGAEIMTGNDFSPRAALIRGDRMFKIQSRPKLGRDAVAGLITAHGATGDIPEERLSGTREGTGHPSDRRDMAAGIAGVPKECRL